MSILSEIKTILDGLKIPNETGIFKTKPAPDTFAVLVPMTDEAMCADDMPDNEVQSVRIELYTKGNYRTVARSVADGALAAGMAITERRYIEHEDETGYHHYAVDLEKNYLWED